MSNSDGWQTPQWLFDELNAEFHFDIDLCATKENSKCGLFYCKDYLNNTLSEEGGIDNFIGLIDLMKCKDVKTAFMNPPYSNPRPFIEKAWEDSRYCKIVCLVKCDPSTKWWSTFWSYGYGEPIYIGNIREGWRGPKPGCEVRFFPKRIKFDPPAGFEGKTTGSSFSSALIIMDRR